jgi:hypothetical protein
MRRYDVLVATRAAEQLGGLHPPNRRRALWMRLMAFAGRGPPSGLAEIGAVDDDVALCAVLAGRRVVLVYAIGTWRDLRERLLGPQLIERLRGREWERYRHGRARRLRV